MSDRDAKPPPDEAGASGSVEVHLSDAKLPAVAAPEPIAPDESAPVSSGRVHAPVEAADAVSTRAKRITSSIQDAVSGGVEKLGTGIGTIGEGVAKLGELTEKVPLVGASVAKVGEGLTRAGETIQLFPRVAKTRRGRLLLRSVIVGFLLVAAWIFAIVAIQLHGNDLPDFRPAAERILVEISRGSSSIEKVYDEASPRFQEIVRKERFVDDMTDMNATFGKFREVTAINETKVTDGPTGHMGRVSVTAAFERGISKGSISFVSDDGGWKLLGIGFEVPASLKITKEQRLARVEACKDAMDAKHCEIHRVADGILQQLRDGHAADVWDAATDIFKKQESRELFAQIQADHARALGAYRRIIDVTEAKVIANTSATFDVLAEFEKTKGVRVVFTFSRTGKTMPWQLRSFKIVVPMPRAEEDTPIAVPDDAGAPAPPPAGPRGARPR